MVIRTLVVSFLLCMFAQNDTEQVDPEHQITRVVEVFRAGKGNNVLRLEDRNEDSDVSADDWAKLLEGLKGNDVLLIAYDREILPTKGIGIINKLFRSSREKGININFLMLDDYLVDNDYIDMKEIAVITWISPFDNPRNLQETFFYLDGVFLGKGESGFGSCLEKIAEKHVKYFIAIGSPYTLKGNFSDDEVPYNDGQKKKLADLGLTPVFLKKVPSFDKR